MELRKRGDVWYVDFRDEAGARIKKSTGKSNKQEAQKVAHALQKGVLDAKAEGQRGKAAVTVAAATQRYVDKLTREGKAASAKENAGLRRKLLGLDMEGKPRPGRWLIGSDVQLHDLTTLLLDDLVSARSAEGNSAQTIAHELKLLRAATRHCKALKLRVPEIDSWPLPEVKKKTRYLSLEEYQALLTALDPMKATMAFKREWQDARDLVVTLTVTGGRWSEVAGATWAQVGAPGFKSCELWGNKSGKPRLAPVTEALRSILQRRYEDPRRHPTLIFPTPSGEVRSDSCRPILKAMDRAGLNSDPVVVERHGRATVHSLRHTFASWLLQSGAGLAEVQDMLGYATLEMTRRYSHLENAKVAKRMAGVLDGLGL